MNILKKIWENKIILFLLVLLFLVVVLKLLTRSPEIPAPIPIPETPSPTFPPIPKLTPTPIVRPIASPVTYSTIQKLITQLPYQSDHFTIQYYQQTRKFVVIITAGPLGQTIEEVETWFSSQGIQDLSQIDVLWQPTREVLDEAGVPRPIPEP